MATATEGGERPVMSLEDMQAFKPDLIALHQKIIETDRLIQRCKVLVIKRDDM